MHFNSICFVAANLIEAEKARDLLIREYGSVAPEKADVIVALGGDGLMLETLHKFMNLGTPIYGMNKGSIGFLMNEYKEEELLIRLRNAVVTELHPLRMAVIDINDSEQQALAINEVALFRETRLAAKINILIDDVDRMQEMICDGVMVTTPAGSTAYNLSAHGPIIPLGAELLAVTPISPFRPRRWRGALLPQSATVTFSVIEPKYRSVSATADFAEVRDVKHVTISQDSSISLNLMYDPEHNLEERILNEQFQP